VPIRGSAGEKEKGEGILSRNLLKPLTEKGGMQEGCTFQEIVRSAKSTKKKVVGFGKLQRSSSQDPRGESKKNGATY